MKKKGKEKKANPSLFPRHSTSHLSSELSDSLSSGNGGVTSDLGVSLPKRVGVFRDDVTLEGVLLSEATSTTEIVTDKRALPGVSLVVSLEGEAAVERGLAHVALETLVFSGRGRSGAQVVVLVLVGAGRHGRNRVVRRHGTTRVAGRDVGGRGSGSDIHHGVHKVTLRQNSCSSGAVGGHSSSHGHLGVSLLLGEEEERLMVHGDGNLNRRVLHVLGIAKRHVGVGGQSRVDEVHHVLGEHELVGESHGEGSFLRLSVHDLVGAFNKQRVMKNR